MSYLKQINSGTYKSSSIHAAYRQHRRPVMLSEADFVRRNDVSAASGVEKYKRRCTFGRGMATM